MPNRLTTYAIQLQGPGGEQEPLVYVTADTVIEEVGYQRLEFERAGEKVASFKRESVVDVIGCWRT